MSPTTPIEGFPKAAVEMVQLVMGHENRRIHPFLVQTSNSDGMCPGISSSCLPPRTGSSPVDYALTTFDHVHIPEASFLGRSLERPDNPQALLHSYVWGIPIGTAVLSVYVSHAAKFTARIDAD